MTTRYRIVRKYHPLYGTWYEVQKKIWFLPWSCQFWSDEEDDAGSWYRATIDNMTEIATDITKNWGL